MAEDIGRTYLRAAGYAMQACAGLLGLIVRLPANPEPELQDITFNLTSAFYLLAPHLPIDGAAAEPRPLHFVPTQTEQET